MARKSEFGQNWWAERWLAVLESFGWDSRLQRGRTYARNGSVLEVKVDAGKVMAKVQGSRRTPYRVTIEISPLGDAVWQGALGVMAEQAMFSAKLLAGQMPENIEDAFQGMGVSLFPSSARELETECSCPDWANPCKHIAAVYYRLGAEFDRDPFLLFHLRGKSKEDTMAALRALRAGASESQQPAAGQASQPEREPLLPLDPDPMIFWSAGAELATIQFAVAPAKVPEAVLKRLAPPSFGRFSTTVSKSLAEMYQTVSRKALELAYDDEAPEKPDTAT